MAHHTEQAGFPAIPLSAGMKLRIRALSPTTDTTVAGVTSQSWAIYGRDLSEAFEAGELPRWVPDGDAEVVI